MTLAAEDWILAGLTALRLVPSGLMLSVLSRGALPAWLGLSLSLALAPALALGGSVERVQQLDAFGIGVCGVRELCLGGAFAAMAALPWLAFGYTLRTSERLGLPQPEALSRLFLMAALVLCVGLGAPRAYLKALAETLQDVPVGLLVAGRTAWLVETQRALQSAVTLGLALGLPLWIALWLVDVSVGLATRPFGGASEEARAPLRSGLALLLAGLLLAPLASRAPEFVRAALRDARGVVGQLSR